MKLKCVDGCKLILAIIVIATVIGLFPANSSKVYAADKIDISGAEVTYENTHQYTGLEIEPEVSVELDGEVLSTNAYKVQYVGNINPGYGTIIIGGRGDYTGIIRRSFKITTSSTVEANEIRSPIYNYELNDDGTYSNLDTTWDTIYFGEYPQSEVTPEDEIYNSLQSATGWDALGDVTIDGVKYRRINYETARDSYLSTSLSDLNYPWDDKTTYHYFRYEPILWRVLSVEGDYALLLANDVLDTQSYCDGQDWTHTQYETSKMRSWLNGYDSSQNVDGIDCVSDNFIDSAFTNEQQTAIRETKVIESLDIRDKIFLPSKDDISEDAYGNILLTEYSSNDSNNTAYAWAMGNWYTHGSIYFLFSRHSYLTTLIGNKDEVACIPVVYKGSIDETTFSPAFYEGIRPAMYINWKEADWTYGGTYKSDFEKSPDYEQWPNVYLDKYEYDYTGTQITPGVTVEIEGKTLVEDTDYNVSYGENVDTGKGTVTVTFKGDYTGAVTRTFMIIGTDIADLNMTLAYTSTEYTGELRRPIITISGLTKGTDFTYSYFFNRDIGTAYAVAYGKGAYSGAQEKTFVIRHTAVEITEKGVDSKGRPTFTYQGNDDAEYYTIYRSESEDGPFEIVTKSSRSNSYTDLDANPGRTYYYRVVVTESDDHTYDSDYTQVSITSKTKVTTPHTIYESYDEELSNSILRWNDVENADGYHVYRADTEDGEYVLIGSTTDDEYFDASAEAGKTYYYKIQGYCALDSSLNSGFTGVESIAYLPVVSGLKSTNVTSSGKPKLTWTAVSGAEQYRIYRSTSKSGTYTSVANSTSTSFTDTSAVAAKTYYYKVQVFDRDSVAGFGPLSNAVTCTCDLAKVTGLKATNVASSGKPKLTWTAVKSADKYYIYRATSKSGTYKKISTTTKTSYTDTSAAAEKTYYYKIKAVYSAKTAANSALSSYISKVCDLKRPTITVKRNSSGKPKVTWAKISGADKYYVYRATTKNGTYKKIATTTKLYYTNTSAKKGKTYYYKVKAVSTSNSNANSALSAYKSCTSK